MFQLRILALLIACGSLLHAQAPAPVPAPTASKLDPRVLELVEQARKLQSQQDSYGALKKLDEADAIFPGSPFIMNIRGSIYTATPLRDYAKARECFEAAEKLAPTAFEAKFNKTELLYVEGKYAEAEAAFSKMLADFQKLREDVRHLIQFKVMICQLKQNKLAEAEKSSAAFTFMDDTPAYYYTKASFAFQKNDPEEARKWVAKAGKIFKPQENAVYLDTIMEAHWLSSITVKDQENQAK